MDFTTIKATCTEPESGSTWTTYTTILDYIKVEVIVWQNGDKMPARFAGQRGVTVHAKCLPGVSHWTVPDSRTLRRLVDRALADQNNGQARVGARWETSSTISTWSFRYPTN